MRVRRVASRAVRLALFMAALTRPATGHAQLRGTDAASVAPVYRIKPSDVPIPPGAKPGDIRRITQPFGAWTLICDENLKARTRICNVSQSFVDAAGTLVFSWSLAATRGGAPVFILRAPVAAQEDRTILVGVGKLDGPTTPVALTNCDANICLGFLPLTPEIQRAITAGREARVRRTDRSGAPVVLSATLAGTRRCDRRHQVGARKRISQIMGKPAIGAGEIGQSPVLAPPARRPCEARFARERRERLTEKPAFDLPIDTPSAVARPRGARL